MTSDIIRIYSFRALLPVLKHQHIFNIKENIASWRSRHWLFKKCIAIHVSLRCVQWGGVCTGEVCMLVRGVHWGHHSWLIIGCLWQLVGFFWRLAGHFTQLTGNFVLTGCNFLNIGDMVMLQKRKESHG